MKKKVLSLALAIILLLSVLPVSLSASAATINEAESNDSYDTADSYPINSTVIGDMSSKDDKDYYKIKTSQNGKMALTFSHEYSSDSNVYWNIVMYQYSSGEYTEFYNQKITAKSGETNKLASIGVSSGTTYYIKISTYYKVTAGFTYNLKNEFTPTDYYEKEINDEYSSATPVALNQTFGGVMNDTGDVDFYKFKTAQDGKIALTFSHDYSDDSNVYWNIVMYEYSSGKYNEFYNQKITAKSGEINKLASIGASSDKTYYIKIYTYYNVTVAFDYSLKNEFTATDYYEKEINNEYASATPVSFNHTYGGVMNDTGDVDYYKFTPSQDGKISLAFSHDYSSDSNIYWNIVMYEYSSGNYTEFYSQKIKADSLETNKLPPIGASSGKIYYIKISTYYNVTVAFDYSLKNEFTPTDYYEKEINKEYSSATPILSGYTYGGVMNDSGDIDVFKISLSGSSTPLTFSHDFVDNSNVYWNVKIIDASTYSEIFSKKVRGSDVSGVITTIDQAGTYYIQISTYYTVTTDYEYTILVGDQETIKPTESIKPALPGDADGDGKLTMLDVTNIQLYLSSMDYQGTEESMMDADIDKNGRIEITDAAFIQRYLAGIQIPYEIG